MATCLSEAAFSLHSHFGEEGPAKAGNAAGLPAEVPAQAWRLFSTGPE